MFSFLRRPAHHSLTALELKEMLDRGEAIVVDVREAKEFAAGHIPTSINMPLSTFKPSELPKSGDRKVVLSCAGGRRSAAALDRCAAAEAAVDTHLGRGFAEWRQAGLPIEV
ncbi:MAG: rhodanese-like domain-containing protein [Pseudomonadota bacterium]|nr:rhodanese-like domain-containing protein [Pseudomonadota bacterium]